MQALAWYLDQAVGFTAEQARAWLVGGAPRSSAASIADAVTSAAVRVGQAVVRRTVAAAAGEAGKETQYEEEEVFLCP